MGYVWERSRTYWGSEKTGYSTINVRNGWVACSNFKIMRQLAPGVGLEGNILREIWIPMSCVRCRTGQRKSLWGWLIVARKDLAGGKSKEYRRIVGRTFTSRRVRAAIWLGSDQILCILGPHKVKANGHPASRLTLTFTFTFPASKKSPFSSRLDHPSIFSLYGCTLCLAHRNRRKTLEAILPLEKCVAHPT